MLPSLAIMIHIQYCYFTYTSVRATVARELLPTPLSHRSFTKQSILYPASFQPLPHSSCALLPGTSA
jgi:hypothetical protein